MTIFLAGLVWWVIAAVLLVWHSPNRPTTTWAVATATAVSVGAVGTVGWIWATRRPDVDKRWLQPWPWSSGLVWIMTMITTSPIVNHVQAPTSAYGVAALWYQITAFVGTLILAVQRV